MLEKKFIKKNSAFFGLFLSIFVLLPSCMKVPVYRTQPLKLVGNNYSYYSSDNKIVVRAKVLSAVERYKLFGRHIQELHDNDNKPLEMIYLSVHNLSAVHYVFCCDDINLTQISYCDIEKLIKKTSSIGRLSVAASGGGLYALCYGMWLSLINPGCGILIFLFALPMLGCVVGGTAGLAVGGYQGIKSIVRNRRITKDLKKKIVHGQVIINSGEQYEGLVFVKLADYSPQFTVTMHEKDNAKNSITFDVDLQQNECV